MGNECSRLNPQVLEDLYHNTTYSIEEITSWYKVFMEDCPSGQLSIEAFKEMFQTYFRYGDSSMYAEHVFRCFDINRDGMIDFREFLIGFHMRSHGTFAKKLQWTFKLYDIDGNGYISPDEMVKVLRSLYKIDFMTMPDNEAFKKSQKCTARIFRQLDRNNDGRISLDEFVDGIKAEPCILNFLEFNAESLL